MTKITVPMQDFLGNLSGLGRIADGVELARRPGRMVRIHHLEAVKRDVGRRMGRPDPFIRGVTDGPGQYTGDWAENFGTDNLTTRDDLKREYAKASAEHRAERKRLDGQDEAVEWLDTADLEAWEAGMLAACDEFPQLRIYKPKVVAAFARLRALKDAT